MQTQLLDAWDSTIRDYYESQLLNSERSLQAAFWANLSKHSNTNRRTFIEPKFRANRGPEIRRIFPDIVVCNTRSIIAVIELKYMPKRLPNYKKDIANLNWIGRNRGRLYVENKRFYGDAEIRKYHFSTQTLFIWAGIHRERENPDGLFTGVSNNIRGTFIQFHAETGPNTNVYCLSH